VLLEETPAGSKLGELCETFNLPYMFAKPVNSTKGKLESITGQSHRSLKLRLFALTMFDKIVYLDTDILVLQNIDELFGYNETLTAAWDPGAVGVHNSGVMVLRPNVTFSDGLLNSSFVSYNGGDQGYLHNVVNSDEWKELPQHYNVLWRSHQV